MKVFKQKMSGVRRERSARLRDDASQRRRSTPTEKTEKERESPSPGGPGNSNIRTRLSTGTLHMNGTQTFKDIIKAGPPSEDSNDSQKMTPAKDSPATIGRKRAGNDLSSQLPPKRRKIGKNDGSGEGNKNDYFCWVCHKEGAVICCELCPRVYHMKCLEMVTDVPTDWVCPECEKIMRAECVDSRSRAMAMISVDTLCFLLKFALERMKHSGSDPFMKPVDQSSVPHYTDYIFHPMDLGILEKNIKKKMYGCTEAFLADAKWILHNCVVFNGLHNKLTTAAKTIIKICRHEMSEIEVCPDCYLNSCVKKDEEWFCEPCREPHPLVWAKLKGYPFWPAKALREKDSLVDVRFFGAHDRSWVATSQVFMLSKDIPTPMRNKRQSGFDNAMEETNIHIEKLRDKFGTFEYAPFRTPYDKSKTYSPIKKKKGMMPSPKKKSALAGPKSSHHFNVVKRKTIDPKSSVTKTASAVRLKYNSIITTRKTSGSSTAGKSPSSVKIDESFSPDLPPFQDPALNVCGLAKLKDKIDEIEKDKEKEEVKMEEDDSKPTDKSVDKSEDEDSDELRLDDSLIEKDESSDDDSVNLLDDRVLDSSDIGSENTSPTKKSDSKRTVDESKSSAKRSEVLIKNSSVKENKGVLEEKKTSHEGQTNPVNTEKTCDQTADVEKVSDQSVKETKQKAVTTKDVTNVTEQTLKESEQTPTESKEVLDDKHSESAVEETCADGEQSMSEGRQTPTDSVDEELVCTAKGGKVSECVKETSSKGKDSAQSDIKDKSEESSAETKCLEKEPLKENESKKKSMEDEEDDEPSLMMEVETESETDQLLIDHSDPNKESPVKIITTSKKSPQKDTSTPTTPNLQTGMNSLPEKIGKKSDPVGVSSLKSIAPKPQTISAPLFIPAQTLIKDNVLTINTMNTKSVINVPQKPETVKIVENVSDEPKSPSDSAGDPLKVALFRSKRSQGSEESSEKSASGASDVVVNEDDEKSNADTTDRAKTVVEKYKSKLLDAMKSTLDDMCSDLVKNIGPESSSSSKHYQQELEKLRWIHLQEVAELKHNFKLTVMEMRSCWDAEKQRLFKDISKLCEKEKNKAIAETKKKQWCAQCGKEAIYYCCWNTSYCTYECQQSDWPEHMPSCMQTLTANQDQEKTDQSKTSTNTNSNSTSTGSKDEGSKKGSPPASKQTEWSEKDEAMQAQRTFNLAPPSTTSPTNPSNSSPQAGTWRNRARDNLEQVLRRQEDAQPQQTVFIPPQLMPGQPPQSAGQPFMQGGQPMTIQYIQPGPPQPQAVHLPPSSHPSFTQPPQVRLQGYPVSQGPGQPTSLLQNVSGYPVLRQQQPHMSSPGNHSGPYMPRSQIFLAPNAQNPRTSNNIPGQMHFQIRPC